MIHDMQKLHIKLLLATPSSHLSNMRYTATAFALTISAISSVAAGWDIENGVVIGSGTGKAGKSGSSSSTKSSKSGDCTSCTAGTLTRANMLTNLVYSSWSVDRVISEESVVAYCNAETEEKDAFLQAVDNTAGCLVNAQSQCFIQRFTEKAYSGVNVTITEGAFETTAINDLCKAEQKGVILPEGECHALDACKAINGGGDDGLLGGPYGDDEYYLVKTKEAVGRLTVANPEQSSFYTQVIVNEMELYEPFDWTQGNFEKALRKGIVMGSLFVAYDDNNLPMLGCHQLSNVLDKNGVAVDDGSVNPLYMNRGLVLWCQHRREHKEEEGAVGL